MLRCISLLGIVAFCAIAWAFSERRRALPWRTIAIGIVLQLVIGALVFLVPYSRDVFLLCNDALAALIHVANSGTQYVFGGLASGSLGFPGGPQQPTGVILAFQVFPIAIFFSAITAAAYRLGIIQPVVKGCAKLFHRTLGISGAEALTTASNIIVGVESALVVRPYLLRMTRSELLVLLTAGMATVASTVLGLYMQLLSGVFPTIGGHLISATLIAIPAAIVIAKILIPESNTPETLGAVPPISSDRQDGGVMATLLTGALDGVKLAVGIAAGLIAVLGVVALVDKGLAYASGVLHLTSPLSLTGMVSYLAQPLAWLLGVRADDVGPAAGLIGQRLVQTEFPAFMQLADLAKQGVIDQRTMVIMSYALCGFAHLASMAVFVGGTAALVPERRADIAGLGFKALLAATLATLMTGAVAGIFA